MSTECTHPEVPCVYRKTGSPTQCGATSPCPKQDGKEIVSQEVKDVHETNQA